MNFSTEGFAVDVVCYSGDSRLVETRKMVFERAGFRTAVATDPSELEAILRQGPVGVLVLCHSLPDAECERADRFVHENYPRTRVLLLNSGFSNCSLRPPDQDYDSLRGPEGLLSTVSSLFWVCEHPAMEVRARGDKTKRALAGRV
jgi:hypothetical protein